LPTTTPSRSNDTLDAKQRLLTHVWRWTWGVRKISDLRGGGNSVPGKSRQIRNAEPPTDSRSLLIFGY